MGILARLVRSSLANPSQALREALGVETSLAGVTVNERTALRASAVWACITLLSGDLASVPLILYRRVGNGKQRADDHPLYRLLHDAPNPEVDSFRFVELVMAHLLVWGNAYAEIVADDDGNIRELWPLAPWLVTPERLNNGRGPIVYRVQLPDGGLATLRKDQVLHIAGFGYDGLKGYSPIRMAAREAIGLALATQEFGARFFGQGARPGLLLIHPGKLSDEAHARLRQSWEAAHGGLSKAHRVAILEEGMKVEQFGIPPEDAQFLETRKFQVTDIARIFRVPPHMIGDHERGATYASVEQQAIDYVTHTLRPWAVRIERAIRQQLLTELERPVLFAEFLLEGLLRGDTESRYRAYATGRQWGWLSANDVRRLENMDPIQGGDVYLVPLNMVPAGGVDQQPQAQEPRDYRSWPVEERSVTERRRLARTYRRILADVAERVVKREVADIRELADRWLRQRAVEDFLADLDRFYRQHEGFVRTRMAPVYAALGEGVREVAAEEVGWDPAPTPDWEAFVAAYLGAMTSRWVGSSRGQLRAIVITAQELGEDIYEAIRRRLDEWVERRPGKFGLWESVQASAAFAKATYAEAGVTKVRWVNFNPSCPYCQSLHGKVVEIHGAFIEPDTDYQPQGADRPLVVTTRIGHPPSHGGCDCGLAPEVSSRGRAALQNLVEIIGHEYRWFEDAEVSDHASHPAP